MPWPALGKIKQGAPYLVVKVLSRYSSVISQIPEGWDLKNLSWSSSFIPGFPIISSHLIVYQFSIIVHLFVHFNAIMYFK
jgi:hypothetical protein